jgi:hypothetical protein
MDLPKEKVMATRGRKTGSKKKKAAKTKKRVSPARKARAKSVKRAAIVKGLSKKGGKRRTAAVNKRARQAGVMGEDASQLDAPAVSEWADQPRKGK